MCGKMVWLRRSGVSVLRAAGETRWGESCVAFPAPRALLTRSREARISSRRTRSAPLCSRRHPNSALRDFVVRLWLSFANRLSDPTLGKLCLVRLWARAS